jgi:hypothetical protein
MSTRAQILAEIAAQFPDNTTGLITPAKLRQVVEDVTNSCLVSDTDAGTAGKAVLVAETPAQGRTALGIAGDASNAMVAPYYVDSVGGNDTNSGRTAAAPLKTLSALVAKGIVDGDRIFLKRGSYFRESLDLGTKNNLLISAYGQGLAPVIDGSQNLTNASFTANGPYTAIYDLTFATPTIADAHQFGVWESSSTLGYDVALQPFASLAALNASASGGFYASGTVLSIKAPDGSDVRSNGKTYSCHAARSYPIKTNHGCEVSFVRVIKPYTNDGVWIGRNSWVHDCEFAYGIKHCALVGSGLVQRCTFPHITNPTWYQNSSQIAFYFNGTGLDDFIVEDCVFECDSYFAGNTALATHADGGGGYNSLTVRRCTFRNMYGVFGNPPTRTATFEQNYLEDVGVVAELTVAGPLVYSRKNSFVFKAKTGGNVWSLNASTALSPTRVYSADDSLTCLPGYAAHFFKVGNLAVGLTAEAIGLKADRGGTSTIGLVYIPNANSGGTIRIKDCKLRDKRVLDCLSATATNTTLDLDNNEYVAGSLWLWNGSTYTGIAAWRAASSLDTLSSVIAELLPPQQQDVVFGATASLGLLNKYLTISGAQTTDRITLRWVGTGPTQWLVIPQITSATALYLACRNCSSTTTTETTYTLVIQLMRAD